MGGALVVFVAIVLAGGVIGAAAYYFWSEHVRARREQEASFRSALLFHLKKKGLSAFDFHELVEEHDVPPDIARTTAANLYTRFCKKALLDAQITESERRQLNCLRRALTIPHETAEAIEAKCKDERFRDAALDTLAGGKITPDQAAELEDLRDRLGLTAGRTSALVGAQARDGYLALFRRVIDDGRITADELEELRRYRQALGISRENANDITRDEVAGLYRQWYYNVIQDGEVTQEEEHALNWLKSEFGLNASDTMVYDAQLEDVKRQAAYRAGKLPSMKTGKLLEGGEICHWEGQCYFEWKTATQAKGAQGELIVTSEQVIFSSSLRSFSISPSKILDIKVYTDAIVIRTGSGRGNGMYRTAQSRELEAILVGLVRRHKYRLSESFSSERTRHIPDSVRREVWHRDGGRCVRCGAADYLEFDHVIPHAKGGANTVANVQLLCRHCNNQKSDRI